MDAAIVGIIGIVILILALFLLGIPVGFAMAVTGFAGFAYIISFKAALNMVGTDIWVTFSKYGLTVIPLFIFMGYLAFHAGIAGRLYDAAYKWIGGRTFCCNMRVEYCHSRHHGGRCHAADEKV